MTWEMRSSTGILTATTPLSHYHQEKPTRMSSLKHSEDSSTSLEFRLSSTLPKLEIEKCCNLSGKVTPTQYPHINRNMRAIVTSHCRYWMKLEMKPLPLLPLGLADTMSTKTETSRYLALL